MAESTFNNFFNNAQPFGLNVKVPEKTIAQVGKTASNLAGGVFEPLFEYLEENQNVFDGSVTEELNKTRAQQFTMNIILDAVDESVNGSKPKFNAMF